MLDLESSVCEVGVGAELQAAVIKTIPANSFQRQLQHHPSSTWSWGPKGRVSPALEWRGPVGGLQWTLHGFWKAKKPHAPT